MIHYLEVKVEWLTTSEQAGRRKDREAVCGQGRKLNVVEIGVKKVDMLSSSTGSESVLGNLANILATSSRDTRCAPRA